MINISSQAISKSNYSIVSWDVALLLFNPTTVLSGCTVIQFVIGPQISAMQCNNDEYCPWRK